MPAADVSRSDSNRSDASQKPRVSFNRDVHVKRIVPRESTRVSGAISGTDGTNAIKAPVRKERLRKTEKEFVQEAAEVLRQADKLDCVVSNKGVPPERFYSLPNRRSHKTVHNLQKNYPSHSLDRRSKGKSLNSELLPPKKPPRTFASTQPTSSKPSIFNLFKNTEKKSKKSNLRRSVSDTSDLKYRPVRVPNNDNLKSGKSSSDNEESNRKINTKKQLSPIIEIAQREDYFLANNSDKENTDKNNIGKVSESVTDQLKDYIDEVDEALYKETGIRVVTPSPTQKKDPIPIIIDLDKAEKISTKKSKLNFGLGKKFKSFTHKHFKSNEPPINSQTRDEEKFHSLPIQISKSKEVFNVDPENTVLDENPHPTIIQITSDEFEKPLTMIHSSQKPADRPPLTKGRTVNTMVQRLSTDSCASPPPTRTNILISPNISVQHNNNQPFSYTKGFSMEKYLSNENLPQANLQPVIYAQVVCGTNGNPKQTVYTTYTNGRRQPQSDSDEGLGGEESSGFTRKFDTEKSFTHFGDDCYDSFASNTTNQLLEEIDKYKAESPILPKYRNTTPLNGFVSYQDMTERGRGDGMDAKHHKNIIEEPSNDFSDSNVPREVQPPPRARANASARRDRLESRINRRIGDKTVTQSMEHLAKRDKEKPIGNNLYVSESSSKYYRSNSNSPMGYDEKQISGTRIGKERHLEHHTHMKKYYNDLNERANSIELLSNGFDSEPKSFDSQISDYRSSPENRRFQSSQNVNSRNVYKVEKQQLLKNRNMYKSTPEIHHSDFLNSRSNQPNVYHDSLPRGDKVSNHPPARKFRSERHLDLVENERRIDRFVDSGIENDLRRESNENFRPPRPERTRRDVYNESEDEGFASSLLIASEKQHTEDSLTRKSHTHVHREYSCDRNFCKEEHHQADNNKYTPRERSIDDGSHYDPRLDKDVSTIKVENKPPKPEKKSSLEKMKSLFRRDGKKKHKTNDSKETRSKSSSNKYEEKEEANAKTKASPNYTYKNRRRLSTPSPSPTRQLMNESSQPIHGSWFKSLDRITRRNANKSDKEATYTSTEDETIIGPSKLSSSSRNLRFFGDTDQESNNDSLRGLNGNFNKAKIGLRSQSYRDIFNSSKTTPRSSTNNSRHKPELDRDIKGSKTNLKPPMSPSSRYRKEDRGRRRRQDISSVESSTEGDSSQQSQRSIVYLHAATVGDIPGPDYLRNGRRAASREDLTSNGSSLIQPQIKTLSRSFSVLAPWRPRHQRDGMDIDYTQYPKSTNKNKKYEQKPSRNTSNRNDNSSTLKKKAQEGKRNNFQMSLNRIRSKENIPSHVLRSSREEISRGSTSTLYKKKDKLPRENSRYHKDRDERRIPFKSQSVESIVHKSKEDKRDVSRSVSIPRDTNKTAGWFKKSKKSSRD